MQALSKQVLPLITYPKDLYLGQLFDQSFMMNLTEHYQIKRVAETGLALAALHYALEGIGIGWLPRSIALRDIANGRLLDISDKLPSKELHVKIVRLRKDISVLAEDVWNQIAVEYRNSQLSTEQQPLPVKDL